MSSTSMRLVRRNISIYIFFKCTTARKEEKDRKENSKCVIERKAKKK